MTKISRNLKKKKPNFAKYLIFGPKSDKKQLFGEIQKFHTSVLTLCEPQDIYVTRFLALDVGAVIPK